MILHLHYKIEDFVKSPFSNDNAEKVSNLK